MNHASGNTIAQTIFPLLIALAPGTTAHADARTDRIRSMLHDFDTGTSEFMRKIPLKTLNGDQTPVTPQISAAASKYDLINSEMDRLEKGRHHSNFKPESLISPAPVEKQDQAEDLVDLLKFRTLEKMETARLSSASLEQHPWSDTYWPVAKGGIAWRYGDPGYPGTFDWKANSDYLLDSHNFCSMDQLSPAEKYDLLVDDSRKTLTHTILNQGKGYYDTYGSVESWMGICHGWAAASYMVPRPEHTIEVLAADGRSKIRFFPSDLKALTSLLWANGKFESRFIGRRCEDKHPPTDENGRILDPACYGENSGTWHLSVVNQIGVSRRSFVMDALHDTEIWNQPIYSYQYTYFNPETKNPVPTLAQAEVALADFASDKFKQYRSSDARSVVGIAMDLTYIAENTPTPALTDSPENDAMITVHYLYDVELGSDHQIVGGEWYSNAHPGFLWTPVPDAHALALGDELLSNGDPHAVWSGSGAIPADWRRSVMASSKLGQPLARIVDTLAVLEKLQ